MSLHANAYKLCDNFVTCVLNACRTRVEHVPDTCSIELVAGLYHM